jgi:hypothetical protein
LKVPEFRLRECSFPPSSLGTAIDVVWILQLRWFPGLFFSHWACCSPVGLRRSVCTGLSLTSLVAFPLFKREIDLNLINLGFNFLWHGPNYQLSMHSDLHRRHVHALFCVCNCSRDVHAMYNGLWVSSLCSYHVWEFGIWKRKYTIGRRGIAPWGSFVSFPFYS